MIFSTKTARAAALLAFATLSLTAGNGHARGLSPFQWRHGSYDYESFFMNGLLGTAVGGTVGLAAGVLGDAEPEDVFSGYILPGLGIGMLGGVIYTMLQPSLFSARMQPINGQPKGLLHFDAESSVLELHPERALPRQEYSRGEEGCHKWRIDLLTLSF